MLIRCLELRIILYCYKHFRAYTWLILQNVIEQEQNIKITNSMNSFKQIKTLENNQGPCPRWGHSMCALDNEIILFGGYQNSKYYKDLWKFDLQTLRWTQIEQKGEVPPPCSNFTMNLNNDKSKMIVFGGGTLNKEKMNWAFELDLATYSWKQMDYMQGEPIPWQRSYHCSEIFGKYLVVFGGEFFHDFDDLWIFNMETSHWTEVKFGQNSMKPKARKFASSFKYQEKMYIVGGCENKYECVADAFYIDFAQFLRNQDVESLEWKQLILGDKDLLKRWGHASTVKDGKAYVFGGRCGNKDLSNLVEINLETGYCTESKLKNSVKGRRKPGFCMKNNTIFLFSGFDGSYLNDFAYMTLISRPTKQYQPNEQDPYLNDLKKQFPHYQPQQLDYKFEKDVINFELFELEACIQYMFSNVETPLNLNGFPGEVCAKQFEKRSKYFEYLIRNKDKYVSIYRPQNMKNFDYEILLGTFVLYMEFGKIILHQQSINQQFKLIPQLIQLAEYYCIDHLKKISQEYMLELFEQRVRAKKTEIKSILESAYDIYRMEPKYGQYACYYALTTLINRLSLDEFNQLYILTSNQLEQKEREWTNTILSKYSFELKEAILNKQKLDEQNTTPQKFDLLVEHKIQDSTNTGVRRCKIKKWF